MRKLSPRLILASLALILLSRVDAAEQAPPSSEGMASWYADRFHGKRTASGEPYLKDELTAAHRSLPFGTLVQVENLRNGRSITVKINDRGPLHRKRIIDLSRAAATELGFIKQGHTQVRITPLVAETN